MHLFFRLLGCFFATMFFAFLLNAPKKAVLPASGVGLVGYVVVLWVSSATGSWVGGNFLGAVAIALLGEVCARLLRMPATIFISAGIASLVPGGGLYKTMLALMQNHMEEGLRLGLETILVAGAIALGVGMVAPLAKIYMRARAKKNPMVLK